MVVVVVGIIFSTILGDNPHIIIVKEQESSFPKPTFILSDPVITEGGGSLSLKALEEAIILAIFAYVVTMIVARTLSHAKGYAIDGNHELVASGLCNIACSCFNGMPVGGVMPISMFVAFMGQPDTRFWFLYAGLIFVVVKTFCMGAFTYLPKSVLAAIVVETLIPAFKPTQIWETASKNWDDGIPMFLTILVTLTTGPLMGIIAGMILSLVLMVEHIATPKMREYGRLPHSKEYAPVVVFPDAKINSSVLVLRIYSDLFFGNWTFVKNHILQAVRRREDILGHDIRLLVLNFLSINNVDTTAADGLVELTEALFEMSVFTVISCASLDVQEILVQHAILDAKKKNMHTFDLPEHFFDTDYDAVHDGLHAHTRGWALHDTKMQPQLNPHNKDEQDIVHCNVGDKVFVYNNEFKQWFPGVVKNTRVRTCNSKREGGNRDVGQTTTGHEEMMYKVEYNIGVDEVRRNWFPSHRREDRIRLANEGQEKEMDKHAKTLNLETHISHDAEFDHDPDKDIDTDSNESVDAMLLYHGVDYHIEDNDGHKRDRLEHAEHVIQLEGDHDENCKYRGDNKRGHVHGHHEDHGDHPLNFHNLRIKLQLPRITSLKMGEEMQDQRTDKDKMYDAIQGTRSANASAKTSPGKEPNAKNPVETDDIKQDDSPKID